MITSERETKYTESTVLGWMYYGCFGAEYIIQEAKFHLYHFKSFIWTIFFEQILAMFPIIIAKDKFNKKALENLKL